MIIVNVVEVIIVARYIVVDYVILKSHIKQLSCGEIIAMEMHGFILNHIPGMGTFPAVKAGTLKEEFMPHSTSLP